MEIVIRVDKLKPEQRDAAFNNKTITIEGEALSISFEDGAFRETQEKARKFDESQELEVEDDYG